MAHIEPFRALRYDPAGVSPSVAVTQPYDKISPAMQARYYAASPYNLARIILGRNQENDTPENNVYARAAKYFREWRQEGILRQDSSPSIYSYSQRFTLPGSSAEFERRGFIALGRLEDYSNRVVFRHEQTLAKPKADRLDLLRATRAHFGQLFMLYEDSGEIQAALAAGSAPDVSVVDEYGVKHDLRQISDSETIASIQNAMKDKKLVIADGHHRYETALTYRNECRAANPASQAGAGPAEFVMMTFVNMNDPALCILPTHRVVHSLASFLEEDFLRSARNFFNIDEINEVLDPPSATAILRESGRTGTTLLAATKNRNFLLHHPDPTAAENLFAGLSLRQQSLDVVQLHKCLLESVLNLSEESIRNQQNLSYVRDTAEALAQVREGRAQIAFLMNPCRVSEVRDIAFAGEVMPQKSTDFYPKLLSGLTIYALD